jgi:hypothetical protein
MLQPHVRRQRDHHLFFGSLAAPKGAHDLSLPHHQDAVGHPQDFRQIGRDEDDRLSR